MNVLSLTTGDIVTPQLLSSAVPPSTSSMAKSAGRCNLRRSIVSTVRGVGLRQIGSKRERRRCGGAGAWLVGGSPKILICMDLRAWAVSQKADSIGSVRPLSLGTWALVVYNMPTFRDAHFWGAT